MLFVIPGGYQKLKFKHITNEQGLSNSNNRKQYIRIARFYMVWQSAMAFEQVNDGKPDSSFIATMQETATV